MHAVLLAATIPLFLGGLLSDIAYYSNYDVQWNNFAAWLIAGGMVFTGLALLSSLIDLFRARGRRKQALFTVVLLLVTFALGLVNSFVHVRDAYGTMPDGLILSAVVTVAAILATWVGFSSLRTGVTP
ncbi:DUF2231 domain-containing protein [Azospirillum rugosum]|uniref:Membrane protein n=1 Tax=Azospirillum rugosum TaxID=416170 RepID=A0ABS4SUD0_9PROT|nr:DUF2231 domain-containing protein [Azospirillum rugosum]MBP2296161.1 putative membrane protein [Azospirillum rugosum]MDQ0527154.1 putative membrane protein [Azospirillum rugosum]